MLFVRHALYNNSVLSSAKQQRKITKFSVSITIQVPVQLWPTFPKLSNANKMAYPQNSQLCKFYFQVISLSMPSLLVKLPFVLLFLHFFFKKGTKVLLLFCPQFQTISRPPWPSYRCLHRRQLSCVTDTFPKVQ